MVSRFLDIDISLHTTPVAGLHTGVRAPEARDLAHLAPLLHLISGSCHR